MKIDKPILAWTIEDLEILRDDPYNLEDMNIEYKVQYNGKSDELRKDIVSFANSEVGGYILYGIKDDPFELVGISRKEVDKLKGAIDSVINTQIDPRLKPSPIMNPIHISNDLYILGVQIFPKEKGLYGIRLSNNPNNTDFLVYSFWIRSDGRKRQLSMEEVNSYIIKTDPYKKKLEVTLEIDTVNRTPKKSYFDRLSEQELRKLFHSHVINGDLPKYLILQGLNNSIRPIIVKDRYILFYDSKKDNWFGFRPVIKYYDPVTIYNTPLDTKIRLEDMESCVWHYPLKEFKEYFERLESEVPKKIKGLIVTEDSLFYSEERKLEDLEFDYNFRLALLTEKDVDLYFKEYLRRKKNQN